jgi:hypothetical protein
MVENNLKRHPLGQYEFLFLAMLAVIIVNPLLADGIFGLLILNVLTSAILISSAYAVSGQRKTLRVSLFLLVPALFTSWSTVLVGELWPMAVSRVLMLAFVSYILGVIALDVLSEKNVTRDTIFGSACVYMLAGFAFADIYMLFQIIEPQSFGQAIDVAPVGSEVKISSELSYFSFVTLTTLGYGDMTPKTGMVRGIATLEAMLGQFYLTVLVARLVGLHLAGSRLTTE